MPRKPAPRRPGQPPWKSAAKKRRGGKPAFRRAKAGPLIGMRRSQAAKGQRGEGVEQKPAAEEQRGARLQKVLAAAGIASRRECEQMITEGRVEVDGKVVSELGARVDRGHQEIKVDGEPLPRPKLVYYAINKPTGVVTTARDPAGRPRVIDLLPPSVGRVFTVGRLDLDSEGLILATNDGELANQLTHPKHGVEKTYLVQVAGHPDPEVLNQLRRGVHLAEGFAHAVDARIKSKLKRSTLLEMVLDEGRNREVRRLLAQVGHKVQRLTRIAVGPIRLGEMPRGAYRRLTQDEVRKLHEAVDKGSRSVASLQGRPPRAERPHGKKPRAGKPIVGQRPPGKPLGFKLRGGRRGAGEQSAQAKAESQSVPGFRRKIVGDANGEESKGQPPRKGRPHGGKPMFRQTKGTKVVGRRPFKRRRREKPQR